MAEFEDPFRPADSVVRPRPGGRRRDGVTSADYRPPPAVDAEPLAPVARELLGVGLNPLVRAASPVLLLTGRFRGSRVAPEVPDLRRHLLEEIGGFEDRARAAGVGPELVLAGRYVLCTALDEAVLSSPWGAQSDWSQHTLLLSLHRESWGGNKFFEMLERSAADPRRHLDLMELQYYCVALGFTGKYGTLERGHARLAEVQRDLYRTIRDYRGTPDPALALRWQGLEDRRNPVIRYVPWWVIGAAVLALLTVTFVAYRTWLSGVAAPVQAGLAKIGTEEFTAPPVAAPVEGPTLKELLAPQEAAGALSAEESNGRTLVTLPASNLFASGSATVNPAHLDLLRRVANQMVRVPGRVLVVGHTDDRPLRSSHYSDNFELSRDRALSVVRILESAGLSSDRIESTGAGSSQPRFTPASAAENRARNRRVEIVHVRGL